MDARTRAVKLLTVCFHRSLHTRSLQHKRTAQVLKLQRLITAGVSVRMQWGGQMVCRERNEEIQRPTGVPRGGKKWICLFYNKLSASQCLCTHVIVVELISSDTANRGRNLRTGSLFFFFFLALCVCACVCVWVRLALSVCLAACSDASLDAGEHTHTCRRYLSLCSHTAFLSCCYLGSTVTMATKDVGFGVGGVGFRVFLFFFFLMRLGFS